jgi:voltage-gated potassium channel Kch
MKKLLPPFKPFGKEDADDPHEMPQFMQELLQLGLKLIAGLVFIALKWQTQFIFFTFYLFFKGAVASWKHFQIAYNDEIDLKNVEKDKIHIRALLYITISATTLSIYPWLLFNSLFHKAFCFVVAVFSLIVLIRIVLKHVIYSTSFGKWEVVALSLFLYIPVGLVFASAYSLYAFLTKEPFIQGASEPFDYIYFSFTTLSSVGYGDMLPCTGGGKLFSIVEGFIGSYILLGVLIAGAFGLKNDKEVEVKGSYFSLEKTVIETDDENRTPLPNAENTSHQTPNNAKKNNKSRNKRK